MARFRNVLLAGTGLVLCACSPSRATPPHRTTDVPKVIRPASQSSISARPTTQPATSPPPECRATQLTPSSGGKDGAAGHLLSYVTLTNTSDSQCLLDGYPRVAGIEASGMQIAGTDGSFFPIPQRPVLLAPGRTATFGLETDTYCAASPAGAGRPEGLTKRFTLTTSASATIELNITSVDLTCGLHLTPYFQGS